MVIGLWSMGASRQDLDHQSKTLDVALPMSGAIVYGHRSMVNGHRSKAVDVVPRMTCRATIGPSPIDPPDQRPSTPDQRRLTNIIDHRPTPLTIDARPETIAHPASTHVYSCM